MNEYQIRKRVATSYTQDPYPKPVRNRGVLMTGPLHDVVPTLRQATADDCHDLLAWRNDPHTRAMSRQTGEIGLDQHLAWFARVLGDHRRYFLIGMQDQRKVGLVRFDQEGDSRWEVGINLNPAERGKGLGKALLAAAVGHFWTAKPGVKLLAEVRLENTASRKIFEACGFHWVGQDAICNHFESDPK